MKKTVIASITSALALTVLLGVLYPLLVTGISQVAFPGNANGQQIHVGGKLVGSKIIGQSFTTKHGPITSLFQTRPSGEETADDDSSTAFANLGPNDKATAQATAKNIKAYLALERPYNPGLTVATIPIDAVTTSASGVDPDISKANAAIQAHRVAAVRHLPLATVMALVHHDTHGRGLGFSGEPGVDVLQLNLALMRTRAQGARS